MSAPAQFALVIAVRLERGKADRAALRGYLAVLSSVTRSDYDSWTRQQRLAFLKFAPVLQISAVKRQGFGPVWKAIADAHIDQVVNEAMRKAEHDMDRVRIKRQVVIVDAPDREDLPVPPDAPADK